MTMTTTMTMTTMTKKRNTIKLRALEPEDAALLYVVENDAAEWCHTDSLAPYSYRQLQDFALTYDPDPFRAGQLRLVVENDQGEAVGLVDLYEISSKNLNAFIGVTTLPDKRVKGYGQAAVEEMTRYALTTLGLRTVAAKILSRNRKALDLFAKAGYVETGLLKDWQRTGEGFEDLVLMQKR